MGTKHKGLYRPQKPYAKCSWHMTSDRVYRWRLLLEEFGPEIEYIKGINNTVAKTIVRLEYDHGNKTSCLGLHQCYCHVATFFNHHMHKHDNDDMYESCAGVHTQLCETPTRFATTGKSEEEIYPAIVSEIVANQCNNKTLNRIQGK